MAARSEARATTIQVVIGKTSPTTIRASNTLEEPGLLVIPSFCRTEGQLSSIA